MDPAYIAALRAGAGSTLKPEGRAKFVNGQYVLEEPQQAPKKKSSLSAWISEASGAGGAAGGAAIGTAILPGLGTIIGGIGGGLIGGFSGKAAESKIRDDKVNWKAAAGEGALSGALGGFGSAFRVGKAAHGLSKAGGGADDFARLLKGESKLAKTGANLEKQSLGLQPGAGATRSRAGLSVKDSEELFQWTKNNKLKGGPAEKFAQAQKLRMEAGKGVDDAISGINRRLTRGEASNVAARIKQRLVKTQGGRLGKFEAQELGKIGRATTLKSMNQRIQQFDNLLNYETLAPNSAKTTFYKIARQELRSMPGLKNPALKDANKAFSAAKRAEDVLGVASSGAKGLPVGRMAGIFPQATQRGVQGLGSTLQKIGAVTGNPLTQGVKRATVGTGLRGAISTQTAPPTEDSNMVEQGYGDPMGGPEIYDNPDYPTGEAPMPPGMGQQEPQSSYSLSQAMTDLADPRNASAKAQQQIMARYEFISKAEEGLAKSIGGGELNVTKPTQEDYTNANTGMAAINSLRTLLQQKGGVPQGTRVPGRNIQAFGIGSDIRKASGAGEYDNLIFNTVEKLLRIQTGAAAPEQEVRRYISQNAPQAGDSPELVAQKLQQMEATFQSVLGLARGGQTQDPYYGQQGNYR